MNVLTIPQPVAIAPHRIHPQTRPGYVHLKVANLETQLPFYQRVLGLRLHWKDGNKAGLGAGEEDIVRLTQIPNGKRYRGVTGIYHFAILFPNRRQLARAISRLFTLNWPNYPTDHIMTKTTYLDDPEGNNIELYCESPEDGIFEVRAGEFYARHVDGRWSDGREPLDLKALFSDLSENDRMDEPVPPEVRMGHFHLYVSDLNETRRFYHDLLGFDDMGIAARFRMGMVSAGGYHHHIGFNTWQGEGAPPPPPDALGLMNISMVLPDRSAWDQLLVRIEEIKLPYQKVEEGIVLKDPSQNIVLFKVAD
ncbi:MAG: VOC family protein [Anaerolineales bacterium]|nr:VOC family protein [Anaerolineales bacterium]